MTPSDFKPMAVEAFAAWQEVATDGNVSYPVVEIDDDSIDGFANYLYVAHEQGAAVAFGLMGMGQAISNNYDYCRERTDSQIRGCIEMHEFNIRRLRFLLGEEAADDELAQDMFDRLPAEWNMEDLQDLIRDLDLRRGER